MTDYQFGLYAALCIYFCGIERETFLEFYTNLISSENYEKILDEYKISVWEPFENYSIAWVLDQIDNHTLFMEKLLRAYRKYT